MVRKIILALVVLSVAVAPVPTLAGDGRAFHGGHQFHGGHERFGHGFHQFGGFYTPYPDDGYAPGSCYWQEGYWGPNQPYIDQYGFERFEPVWVPGQSVCS
jgi:hypothetical protein